MFDTKTCTEITLHFHVQTACDWNKATHVMEFQQRRIQSPIKDVLDWGLLMGDSVLWVAVCSFNIFKIVSDRCVDSEVHILTSVFFEIMPHN